MRRSGKTLLYLGSGYGDLPLILAAQEHGFYVVTCSSRHDDPGHSISNDRKFIDYSDSKSVLELAKQLSITAIVPSCNDFAALTASYVAEELDLPGHDSLATTQAIHHKDKFKTLAAEINLSTPKAIGFSNPEEATARLSHLKFPLIIKPVDLTGGKGISVTHSINAAKEAMDKAFTISRAKRIVIEEFVEGSRHGYSTIIHNGKVVFEFIDNEYYYLNPYMVSAASSANSVPKDAVSSLRTQIEQLASHLRLVDGIVHVQFVLRKGLPLIIEICRRPPGDLYVKLVKLSTGMDYPMEIIKGFIGDTKTLPTTSSAENNITRHCIMANQNGKIKRVNVDTTVAPYIKEQFLWWKSGTEIKNYLVDKLGIVFLQFPDKETCLSISSNLNNLITVEMM